MAALASVGYRCSDLRWCYLQQTVHFFQSDTHTVIPNKFTFTSLHWSISNFILKGLRSDKPLHKHDSNKYQTKAFGPFVITNPIRPWFDRCIDCYLNNPPIRSCVRGRTRGIYGQAFPSLPSPSPSRVIPSYLLLSLYFLEELARKRLLLTQASQKILLLSGSLFLRIL